MSRLSGMLVPKMKSYKGGDLKGDYLFTLKKDGVNVRIDCGERIALSKNDKPLYNFEDIFDTYGFQSGMYEVFDTNWETSISLVKNRKSGRRVQPQHLFSVGSPYNIQSSLVLGSFTDPNEGTILDILKLVVADGHEGMVLYNLDSDIIYKVKPTITVDIMITDVVGGTGKYSGMMGALVTNYGNVGTGFTDEMRSLRWFVGDIIEVEAMGWTPNGKLRHPRFKRLRVDKDTENLENT